MAAVILFGSRARGDYDKYSDYDVLVVFQSDEVIWRNRRKLYENVGKLGHGCFMIPMENLKNVTEILNQHNVQFKVITTFAPG